MIRLVLPLFIVICASISLLGCSSGSDEERDTNQNADFTQGDDESDTDLNSDITHGEISTPHLLIGSSLVELSDLRSPLFDSLDIRDQDEVSSFELPSTEDRFISTANDINGNIIYLNVVNPGDDILEIDEYSTVEALLQLVPGFVETYQEYLPLLKEVPEVRDLAEYIYNNPDWSYTTKVEFEDLLASVIVAANKILDERNASNISAHSPDFSASTIFPEGLEPNRLIELGELVRIERKYQKDGVSVNYNLADNSDDNASSVTFEIKNTTSRYVVGVVSSVDPNELSPELQLNYGKTFVLGANEKISANDLVLSKTISQTNDSSNRYRLEESLYLYGPGGNSTFAISNTEDFSGLAETSFAVASILTIVQQQAIPVLYLVTGVSRSCLSGHLDSNWAVNYVNTNNEITETLRSEQKANINAQYLNERVLQTLTDTIPSCVVATVRSQLIKTIPIFGQVYSAYKKANAVYDLTMSFADLSSTNKFNRWSFSNTNKPSITVKDYWQLDTGDELDDPIYYVDDNLVSLGELASSYLGTCRNSDTEQCVATYEPMLKLSNNNNHIVRFDVEISCGNEPDQGAIVKCSRLIVTDLADNTQIVDFDNSGQTVLETELQLKGIKEHVLDFKIIDQEGGISNTTVYVQPHPLYPEIVAVVDGQELNYEIENKKLVSDVVTIPCCDAGLTYKDLKIKFVNKGFGIANLSDLTQFAPDSNDIEIIGEGGKFLYSPESDSQSESEFTIRFTPESYDEDEPLLRLGGVQSSLGAPDITKQSLDEYDEIFIPLKLENDRPLLTEDSYVLTFENGDKWYLETTRSFTEGPTKYTQGRVNPDGFSGSFTARYSENSDLIYLSIGFGGLNCSGRQFSFSYEDFEPSGNSDGLWTIYTMDCWGDGDINSPVTLAPR